MQCLIVGFARSRWFVPGFIALVLVSAYASVVMYNYGWTDDFASLYFAHFQAFLGKMQSFYNVQGRPLGGVFVQTAFRTAGSLDGLRWVRMAQLGLALACGWILAAEFLRVVPVWIGLGAVSLVLLSPAMAVFVAWPSSGLLNLPSALLALAGSVWWLQAYERRGLRDTGFWLRAVAAAASLLAALLTYQSSACFFLLPATIRLLDGDPLQGRRGGIWTVGGFAVICGVYFVAFRLVQPWLAYAHTDLAARSELVTDIPARLRFLWTYVLRRSFESWGAFLGPVPKEIMAGVGALLTLLFLIRLAQAQSGWIARLHILGLVACYLGLATSPLLIVKDSYAPYRTLGVIYSLAAVGTTGGILALFRSLPMNWCVLRRATAAFWIGLLAANFLAAGYVTTEGFVLRSVRETNIYRRFLHGRLSDYPSEVVLILPDTQNLPKLSRIYPDNEFGTTSSFVEWTFPGMFCSLISKEMRRVRPSADDERGWLIAFYEVQPDRQTLFPSNLPVIDIGQAMARVSHGGELSHSGPVIQDPFFGEIQRLTPTWQLSWWFGLYTLTSPQQIMHHELGRLELAGRGGEDCWFHHDKLGWFWTNPALFPRLYSAERHRWLRYVRGTAHPTEFLDADAPDQVPVPVR